MNESVSEYLADFMWKFQQNIIYFIYFYHFYLLGGFEEVIAPLLNRIIP